MDFNKNDSLNHVHFLTFANKGQSETTSLSVLSLTRVGLRTPRCKSLNGIGVIKCREVLAHFLIKMLKNSKHLKVGPKCFSKIRISLI